MYHFLSETTWFLVALSPQMDHLIGWCISTYVRSTVHYTIELAIMSIKEVEKTVIFQSVCLRHLDFRELHIKLLLKGPQIGRYSAYPEVNFSAKCLAKECLIITV